jgi:hypothetical protein
MALAERRSAASALPDFGDGVSPRVTDAVGRMRGGDALAEVLFPRANPQELFRPDTNEIRGD